MSEAGQQSACGADTVQEDPAFLREQIITYIGNKRALLDFIGSAVQRVKARLGKQKLVAADLFSGSGIVSRFLKQHASLLISNDLEDYSRCINTCYLANRSAVNLPLLAELLHSLRADIERRPTPGFITEMYAPADDNCIRSGERVFFTHRNAVYIDTARRFIGELPEAQQPFFLAPLLYEASVHNNTGGVFKGFYKNSAGIGQFGGQGRHALSRIMGNIELSLPVFSAFECEVRVTAKESLEAALSLPESDLVYLDPPYNQHPYGSNYFMLNLILRNRRPTSVSDVSGIPEDWNRSAYNKPAAVRQHLVSVIRACPAPYVLLSYNSEGFIPPAEMQSLLSSLGRVQTLEHSYQTFRACRNLRSRSSKVKEYLFLLEKS